MGLPQKKVLLTDYTIASGGSVTTEAFGVAAQGGVTYVLKALGVSGTAVLKAEYLVGPTINGNFVEPGVNADAGDFITDLSSATSATIERIDTISGMPYSDSAKIKITSASNSCTVSLWVYLPA